MTFRRLGTAVWLLRKWVAKLTSVFGRSDHHCGPSVLVRSHILVTNITKTACELYHCPIAGGWLSGSNRLSRSGARLQTQFKGITLGLEQTPVIPQNSVLGSMLACTRSMRLFVFTYAGTYKYTNLSRDPGSCLCLYADQMRMYAFDADTPRTNLFHWHAYL